MNISSTESTENEVYFKDLFIIAWKFKFSIILITAVAAIASVYYAIHIPNTYKSEALMSISDSSSSGSDLSRYSGLASIAGINIPQSSSEDKLTLAIETIRSREIVERLIKDEIILINLMAAKSFNWSTNKLYIDPEIYSTLKSEWLRTPSGPFVAKPSSLEAHRAYMKSLSIRREGNYFTLSIEHISPIFAKTLLEQVIKEVNTINREKDKSESYLALEYLKSEYTKTPLKGMQQSINALIEGQLQKQMVANIREEYLISAIDKPFIPEFKSSPNRGVLCIMGTVFGFIFALLISLLREFTIKNYLKGTS
jgi:uncharacterized protein involved in exopolysaccharide biosynthesis